MIQILHPIFVQAQFLLCFSLSLLNGKEQDGKCCSLHHWQHRDKNLDKAKAKALWTVFFLLNSYCRNKTQEKAFLIYTCIYDTKDQEKHTKCPIRITFVSVVPQLAAKTCFKTHVLFLFLIDNNVYNIITVLVLLNIPKSVHGSC